MRRCLVLVVLLVVTGVLLSATAAANEGNGATQRLIKLSATQDTGPWADASGQLNVQTWTFPEVSAFVNYTLHQTPCPGPAWDSANPPQFATDHFSLSTYIYSVTLGRFRLDTYCTPQGGNVSSFANLPDLPEWATDGIVVEVWIEGDDGFYAPDVEGEWSLILRGEIPAQP